MVRDGQRAATIDQRRPEMARERPRATRHGQKTAKETLKLTRNRHKAIPRLTKGVQLIPDIIKSSLYFVKCSIPKIRGGR